MTLTGALYIEAARFAAKATIYVLDADDPDGDPIPLLGTGCDS